MVDSRMSLVSTRSRCSERSDHRHVRFDAILFAVCGVVISIAGLLHGAEGGTLNPAGCLVKTNIRADDLLIVDLQAKIALLGSSVLIGSWRAARSGDWWRGLGSGDWWGGLGSGDWWRGGHLGDWCRGYRLGSFVLHGGGH